MTRPPSPMERSLVVDLVARVDDLIGSESDIWGNPAAIRMLVTMRWVIRGIFDLVSTGRAVGPSRVRHATTAIAPSDELHELAAVVDHMLTDPRARSHWDDLMPDKSYPHRCPRCGLAGYIGFRQIECKTEGCR